MCPSKGQASEQASGTQLGPAAPESLSGDPAQAGAESPEDRAELLAASSCQGQLSPLVLHFHLEPVQCWSGAGRGVEAELPPPPQASCSTSVPPHSHRRHHFSATTFPPPALTGRRAEETAGCPQTPRGERTSTATHLYPVLRQLRLHSQHLPGIDVGVVSFIKSLLQLFQLVSCEHRPAEKRERPVTQSRPLRQAAGLAAPSPLRFFPPENPPPQLQPFSFVAPLGTSTAPA